MTQPSQAERLNMAVFYMHQVARHYDDVNLHQHAKEIDAIIADGVWSDGDMSDFANYNARMDWSCTHCRYSPETAACEHKLKHWRERQANNEGEGI